MKDRVTHLNATVCYLKKDNQVLMIQFDKKWGQVYAPPGGKFESGESPLDCIIREFKEETGLTLIHPRLQGISYWRDSYEGIIFIYTAEEYQGEMLEASPEGKLEWIKIEDLPSIKQFEQNEKFTPYLFQKQLFEGKEIRSIWNAEQGDYYFSVVDVIEALTESPNPRNYWNMLKKRLEIEEESELYTKCVQLKMVAKDGKSRNTDTLDTKGILRLIESVPSPKAEPFKLWLAQTGSDRIDEIFDPEIAVKRAVQYYRNRGYSDEWIEARLKGILNRNKLTDVWKESGINENYEFAILTNEIYQAWSGMKASEYKTLKGIRKESLRDNMTDIEVALTDLGKIATRELTKKHKPYGLEENKKIASIGGDVAKVARDDLEKKLGATVISNENALPYQYRDNKVSKIGS